MPAPARPFLLIAHGSRDPRHAATVAALAGEVRAQRPGLELATAYLDHCAPRIPQVADRLGSHAVAVPLLLNRAFHAKHDIPAALRSTGAGLPVADVLGPSPLLLAALDRRLDEAGLDVSSPAVRARTGLVLAAAGSSDPAADAATRAVAAEWRRTRGWAAVEVAYASATASGTRCAPPAPHRSPSRPTCWPRAGSPTGSPGRRPAPTSWPTSSAPPPRSPPCCWSATTPPPAPRPGRSPHSPPEHRATRAPSRPTGTARAAGRRALRPGAG